MLYFLILLVVIISVGSVAGFIIYLLIKDYKQEKKFKDDGYLDWYLWREQTFYKLNLKYIQLFKQMYSIHADLFDTIDHLKTIGYCMLSK